MTIERFHPVPGAKPQRGFTLMELIVAAAIMSILTLMAIPLARATIQREREKELRRDLWEMRDAIDRYKDAADRNMFQTKLDSGATRRISRNWSRAWKRRAARKFVFCVLFLWTP